MSTSLLYHAWGLRGYDHLRTEYTQGATIFRVADQEQAWCPVCNSEQVIGAGSAERWFKGLPIGSRPVWIVLAVPRVECQACGSVRQVPVRFAEGRRGHIRKFERYVLELSDQMTIDAVANHLGVSWDLVKDIQKRSLQRRSKRIRLKKLTHIAIDEISIGKGHRFRTVVMDLQSGAVVFVGEGKGAEALAPFWRHLRASRARIEAVATDMSAAYTEAIRENLPWAIHVFDRFHVVKLFNDKLTELRRELQRRAEAAEKDTLKGTRWLLLKDPGRLEDTRDEHRRLEEALALNAPLATAYYLKEEFRQFWSKRTRSAAEQFLEGWLKRAKSSGVKILEGLAKTISSHREGLLAWYDCPITTGPLEGMNNKIKTMQRQHYGIRDQEFFRLKLFAIHEASFTLVGAI